MSSPTLSLPLAKDNEFRIYSHRSGIEEGWRCDRNLFLGYAYLGTGIGMAPKAVWLDVGIAVHAGLSMLISGQDATESVEKAVKWFREGSGQQGHLHPYNFEEQACLVEGLLWAFVHFTLKAFLNQFEVLWVECEITESVVKQVPQFNKVINLVRMSRPDAIVRDKNSGEVIVISWKTVDDLTAWRKLLFKHDLQGLMEIAFSEKFFAERKRSLRAEVQSKLLAASNALEGPTLTGEVTLEGIERAFAELKKTPEQVDYVQTIYLQKGKRVKTSVEGGDEENEFGDFDEDPGEGMLRWRTNSFLIYPWVNRAADGKVTNVPGNPAVSWKWQFNKPGNKSYSTLGKEYKREMVAIEIGVKDWVERLYNKSVFPSNFDSDLLNPLSHVIIWDNPAYRNRVMLHRLVKQTEISELERAERLIKVERYIAENGYDAEFEDLIDGLFPQHLNSCSQPWRCQFRKLCHDTPNPVWGSVPDGYEVRIPHHDPELDYMVERGFLER